MSDNELLLQFYGRTAPFVSAANKMRLGLNALDLTAVDAARTIILGMSGTLLEEISQQQVYDAEMHEWKFAFAAWNHDGRHGSRPPHPKWPSRIPRFQEAINAIRVISGLRQVSFSAIEYVEKEQAYKQLRAAGKNPIPVYPCMVDAAGIIKWMNSIKRLLDSPESNSDGKIARPQLAKLLGISQKTLANHAKSLPKPVARTWRGNPIYDYLPVKSAVEREFPERAIRLPATCREALEKAKEKEVESGN